MRTVFRLSLVAACGATAAAGALAATAPAERAAFATAPLLACVALLLISRRDRRPRRRRLRDLEARLADLFDQLQRERIESGNRVAGLEARLSSLEREQEERANLESLHREHLVKLRGALTAHEAQLDAALASLGTGSAS